jgi:hypothetical protein
VPADFSSLMACSYWTSSDGDLRICHEALVPFAVSVDLYPSTAWVAAILASCLWLPFPLSAAMFAGGAAAFHKVAVV